MSVLLTVRPFLGGTFFVEEVANAADAYTGDRHKECVTDYFLSGAEVERFHPGLGGWVRDRRKKPERLAVFRSSEGLDIFASASWRAVERAQLRLALGFSVLAPFQDLRAQKKNGRSV